MQTINVVGLRPGMRITHDGSQTQRKPIVVEKVREYELDSSQIVVNNHFVFHKSWEVTVK